MLKLILKSLTFIGSLSMLFAASAQAEFSGYQVLSQGSAKAIRTEAVAEKEGFLANLPFVGNKLERKYGEKATLEVDGNCNVSLMDSSVIIDVEKGPIRDTFVGTNVFVITGYMNKNQSRKVTLTGARGERLMKGLSVYTVDPNVRYNEYIRHPVERFCQNFIKQVPNVRTYHLSVGNETKQRLEIDEKEGTILISEEGICNITTHKVALRCTTGVSQVLSDYLDFLEQKIVSE